MNLILLRFCMVFCNLVRIDFSLYIHRSIDNLDVEWSHIDVYVCTDVYSCFRVVPGVWTLKILPRCTPNILALKAWVLCMKDDFYYVYGLLLQVDILRRVIKSLEGRKICEKFCLLRQHYVKFLCLI